MIPLRDDNPTRHFPFVTLLLIAVNILFFLYCITSDGFKYQMSAMMIPKELLSGMPSIRHFQLDHSSISVAPLQPLWITIFSSMFLHEGWMHLGGNMLYLWIFGNNIEDALGHIKYTVFYLFCGVISAVCHIMSAPNSNIPTLGASGAIAGVLGAYLILYASARVTTLVFIPPFFYKTFMLPAWVVLGGWFVLQLFNGVGSPTGNPTGGVAYWAHIGGFMTGVLTVYLFRPDRISRRRSNYF